MNTDRGTSSQRVELWPLDLPRAACPSELVDVPPGEHSVITIRLPSAVHATLIEQAHELGMSLNRLCIVKLSIGAEGVFVPTKWIAAHKRQQPTPGAPT